MSQLTLDSAVLEEFLERAALAARQVGNIEDKVACGLPVGEGDVDPLADEINMIVHELSELLGNPDLIAAHVPRARSTFEYGAVTRADVVTRDGLPEFGVHDAPTVSGTDTVSLRIPTPYTALASEREASRASRAYPRPLIADANPGDELTPVPEPIERAIAFTEDDLTRPRVRRLRPTYDRRRQGVEEARTTMGTEAVHANDWQARSRRARASEGARSETRWVRSATVTALIVLIGLVLLVAGTGGGAR